MFWKKNEVYGFPTIWEAGIVVYPNVKEITFRIQKGLLSYCLETIIKIGNIEFKNYNIDGYSQLKNAKRAAKNIYKNFAR